MSGRRSAGRAGRLALWSLALATVLAAHAAVLAWSMRQRPSVSGESPASLVITLLPAPVVPVNAPPPAEVVEPAFLPAPASEELRPIEEAMELPSTPLPPPMLAAPPAATEPSEPMRMDETPSPFPTQAAEMRPVARPAARRLQMENRNTTPAEEAPRERARAAALPPATTGSAAHAASRGAPVDASANAWQRRLLAHIERRKRYPANARKRREEGTVLARFQINMSGQVISVRIARSSGQPELDAAVLTLIRNASPVPTPPPGAALDITAPVEFRLGRR